MKFFILITLLGSLAHAETWVVGTKSFDNKTEAIRFAMSSGQVQNIEHTECLFLTQKLSFKKCPKSKAGNFENLPFTNVSATK